MNLLKGKNKKLSQRVGSFLLAAVLTLGLMPLNQMSAYGKTEGMDQAVTEHNGKMPVTATLQNHASPTILSKKKPHGVASWMGSYSSDEGFTGFAYCINHTKSAVDVMELEVSRSVQVTDNPVLVNAYIYGANDERMHSSYRGNIQRLIEDTVMMKFGNWSTMSDSAWRRATQLAIWMALPDPTGTGAMMSIEGQVGWDSSGTKVSMDDPDAYDYIANANNTDPEVQQILLCAKGLFAMASYRWNVEHFSFARRVPGIYTYPTLQSNEGGNLFGTYWDEGSRTLDFSDAGDEPGKGTIADAYDDQGPDDSPIELNPDTNCYEILWMTVSRTQLMANEHSYFHIKLSGSNLPAGTYLRGLTEEEVDEYLSGIPYENSPFYHPDTSSTSKISLAYSAHPAGEAFTETSMLACSQDTYLYSAFFKVCVPATSVETYGDGQSIHIDVEALAYDYKVFLGQNLSNAQWQPFMLGSLATELSSDSNIVWAGQDASTPPNPPSGGNTTPPPSHAVISKVDVQGGGIAGTQFRLTSIGNGINRTVSTNALGVIELQWTDPTAANYYPPGDYTVTEIVPTDGYNLDDRGAQHLTLYSNGTHSGPISFVNTKKPTITVVKVDGNSTALGLSGVYFNVWKDGAYLGQIGPTNGSGEISYAGQNGQGLSNGYYEFQEAIAKNGYLLSTERKGIHVDLSTYNNQTQLDVGQVVFKNYKYPAIRIRKTDADTKRGLSGAVFEV